MQVSDQMEKEMKKVIYVLQEWTWIFSKQIVPLSGVEIEYCVIMIKHIQFF